LKCQVEKLSAFADGDLRPREAARVSAHVAGCAACRRALDELEQLQSVLGALPAPEAPDSWAELARRLPEPRRARVWWPRWLLAPSLAAVGALAVWLHHARTPAISDDALIAQAETEFHNAEAQYLHALEKLRSVGQRTRNGWSEPRRREYDAALAALEDATEKCRTVARERPADPEVEEVLFAAYRKQIDFLQEQMWRSGERR
jgi:hypothetical protein